MHRGRVLRLAKVCARAVCPVPIWRWVETVYYGRFDEPELSLVPYLCDPNRDAIDIGANIGCYTLFMRHHARHVYAFEPIPWLAVGLARKFDADDVTIYPMALSRSAGCAPLHIPKVEGQDVTGLSSLIESNATSGFARHDIAVPTCPLDHAFAGDAGFVKIDVEGHEEAVLEGARATIERCRPNILIESEERHARHALEHVRRFFKALDYRGYFIRRGRIQPVDEFDPATMQRPEDLTPVEVGSASARNRNYINNFMFLPGERAARVLVPVAASIGAPASPFNPGKSEGRSNRLGLRWPWPRAGRERCPAPR